MVKNKRAGLISRLRFRNKKGESLEILQVFAALPGVANFHMKRTAKYFMPNFSPVPMKRNSIFQLSHFPWKTQVMNKVNVLFDMNTVCVLMLFDTRDQNLCLVMNTQYSTHTI